MRGGIDVDVNMQAVRIVGHCFTPNLEYWKAEEVELKGGGTITHIKRHEDQRCPEDGHVDCEIYKDHIALGLSPSLLPCQGAPIPDEIVRYRETGEEEFFDSVDIFQHLRTALNEDIRRAGTTSAAAEESNERSVLTT